MNDRPAGVSASPRIVVEVTAQQSAAVVPQAAQLAHRQHRPVVVIPRAAAQPVVAPPGQDASS